MDPTYDAGFKLTFGRENVSEELLIELLNAIFADDPFFGNINHLKYLNTDHPHERVKGKGIRYDLFCETSSGHRFIVEMQRNWKQHFVERAVYYVSRAVAEQGYMGKEVNENEWDYALMPVVGVMFCNFNISELPDKPITRVGLCDTDTGKPLNGYVRYVFIQLASFNKSEEECENYLDEWIYNIKNMGPNQNVAFTAYREIFRRLEDIGNVATLSPEDRRSYEADLKFVRDRKAELSGAHSQGFAEGKAEERQKMLEKTRLELEALNLPAWQIESILDNLRKSPL
jgi:predicted transposase/invertase (TIGR01784 family)